MPLYCDDINCPNLNGGDCELGFDIKFKVPRSYQDIQNCNWGYKMAKACRLKQKRSGNQNSFRHFTKEEQK